MASPLDTNSQGRQKKMYIEKVTWYDNKKSFTYRFLLNSEPVNNTVKGNNDGESSTNYSHLYIVVHYIVM